MEPLQSFLDKIIPLSEESFLANYPDPYLITSVSFLQYGLKKTSPQTEENVKSSNLQFRTVMSNSQDISSELEISWGQNGWAIPLVSKKGRDIMQMINLGRTENNDVVLPLPSISKFHAYIMIYEGNECYLRDGGSANGTFLNGKKLDEEHKYSLQNGNILKFGRLLEFEFFLPEVLYSKKNLLMSFLHKS